MPYFVHVCTSGRRPSMTLTSFGCNDCPKASRMELVPSNERSSDAINFQFLKGWRSIEARCSDKKRSLLRAQRRIVARQRALAEGKRGAVARSRHLSEIALNM